MYFHADVLAVRVGGTGTGNAGDFLSWVERGVVINKSGVLSIARERDTIQGSGNVTTSCRAEYSTLASLCLMTQLVSSNSDDMHLLR